LFEPYQQFSAGDITFLYDRGMLRKIAWNGEEILRGIYVAVRDKNWGTVPFQVIQEDISDEKGQVGISVQLHFQEESIDYSGTLNITVRSSGEVSYCFEGKAHTRFLKNRIGINVLLPVENTKGKNVTITHTDGSQTEGFFSDSISPHQPALNISGLSWLGNYHINLGFSGDVFEMEDHRNWTDASYKVYSTPLSLPFPVVVDKGTTHTQALNVSVKPLATSYSTKNSKPSLSKSSNPVYLPFTGLGLPKDRLDLTAGEITALKKVPFDYLSYYGYLSEIQWYEKLHSALRNARNMGVKLLPALIVTSKLSHQTIELLLKMLQTNSSYIFAVEVFSRENFLSSGPVVKEIIRLIRDRLPEIRIGGGTYAYYAELNRSEELEEVMDYITFSICPQVHAFDNLTLAENLKGQEYAVKDAKNKFSKPVGIGPVTLKQRMIFVATEDTGDSAELAATEHHDPRQTTAFAALWTLGSMLAMAKIGAKSVTYYETTGNAGIMQSRNPENSKNATHQSPLVKYPMYGIFDALLQHKNQKIVPVESSHPELIQGISLNNEETWIWNYSDQETSFNSTNLISGNDKPDFQLFDFKSFQWLNVISKSVIPPHGLIRVVTSI